VQQPRSIIDSSRLSQKLGRLLGILSALLLAAIAVLTTIDVIGRDIFDSPVPGGYETTALMLMTLFFLALPIVTARNEHIAVNLIDNIMPPAGLKTLYLMFNIVAVIAMAVLTWFVWLQAIAIRDYGDVTLYLQIPVSPFIFLAAVSCGVTALVFAAKVIKTFREF
jgi:TRAP-type C4-dicarboxylate transport system permease small subunit